ncbi:lysophospholipase L1-like esterase [Desulfocapsa sulfexigens DSM 10523]|uniref:Lysophospholipase L1-like esterase n=1 Tax=Desulfocapsa sulfexigens (strain DSM 10523 / SB164P1) TaxID=1167006 RepID=M1P5I2_DESSD|nr:arylesterase [Desulfocapsa sulfexigens]AGF76937.1 lysophospholipase L1-like esterase [Desulfocapsa sulfexigens DSM 10523]
MKKIRLKYKAGNIFGMIFWLFCVFLLLGCDQQENPTDTGKPAVVVRYKGTIIAVGDSLTAGLGVMEEDAWPAIMEKKLHRGGYHWQVINAGISGETSSGALSRMQWIVAQKPEIVILETGANDGFRGIPPVVVRQNISKAVQILQEADITVLLAGMQIVQNLGADYTREFAEIYPSVAHEQGCLLIPFFLQQVAGEAALNQADTIHPNEKGHAIIAETVYPFVKQAIGELSQQAKK